MLQAIRAIGQCAHRLKAHIALTQMRVVRLDVRRIADHDIEFQTFIGGQCRPPIARKKTDGCIQTLRIVTRHLQCIR